MQHIWEAHAGKASPEVLPPLGLHTGSPPHAAGLLGPAFRVSPCREAEMRLEISSSVLFPANISSAVSLLSTKQENERCWQSLGASLGALPSPHTAFPQPALKDHPSHPLLSPSSSPKVWRDCLKNSLISPVWKEGWQETCPSGDVCFKIKIGGGGEVEEMGVSRVGLQLSTMTSARAGAVHRGAKSGGGVGAPLGSPLHRDLGQAPEALQGTCQLSPPCESTNCSSPFNWWACEPFAAPESQTGHEDVSSVLWPNPLKVQLNTGSICLYDWFLFISSFTFFSGK